MLISHEIFLKRQPQHFIVDHIKVLKLHRLKYGIRSQSFFGLLCTTVLIVLPPPHLGSYSRALLVSQDRRHLFVTPCKTGSALKVRRLEGTADGKINIKACLLLLLYLNSPSGFSVHMHCTRSAFHACSLIFTALYFVCTKICSRNNSFN
jgi:hypothetical protein